MDFSKIEGSIRFCPFLYEGTTRHFICRYREYCCSKQCCASNAFTFYQLWYFWLLLLLIILVCSGSGWWFRWRQTSNQLHHSPHPTHLRRRGAARRGVYPRYQEPHPLDADPPSYREVMRRLSDFPQPPTTTASDSRGNSDMGWVTAPPPSYEAIHDLRNQQKKLDRDIRNAEQSTVDTAPSGSDPYQETLRRGASARSRPTLSARERIRALLGRVMPSRYNNHDVVAIPKEPTRSEPQPPPPYMISTHHHFHQQPVAWSVDTPTMAVHPSFRPPPGYTVNPHLRSSPHYPMMYTAPYVAYPPYNHPMMNNDVDEWSRVDTQPRAVNITAAVPALTAIPGEYHPPVRETSLQTIAQTISSPSSSGSSSNSRALCSSAAEDSATPETTTNSNQEPSAGSSNQDGETSSQPSSPSSRADEAQQSTSADNGASHSQENSVPTSSNENEVDYYTEFVSTSAHRFATRPVSSTTLPTPGRTGITVLPGSASEPNLPEEGELDADNSSSLTSNESQVSASKTVMHQPNSSESLSESSAVSSSSAPRVEEECTSYCGDRLPTIHQTTRQSGAVAIEMDLLNSSLSDSTTSDSTNQQSQRPKSSTSSS